MKIAIYTIALNEAQFVKRWVSHNQDADHLIVCDTGSTDGTRDLLVQQNVTVHDICVSPWRFDQARNTALHLIPADVDVCVSVDMDECMAPGWRTALERAWQVGTTRLRYNYVWAFHDNGDPKLSFWGDKCHARHNYVWRRPVHETVFSVTDSEQIVNAPDVHMWHKQDANKPRSQYMHLLEASHKEDPTCAQTMFWLAREHVYYKHTDQAIQLLKKYLDQYPTAWADERSEAHVLLARLMPHDRLHHLRMATLVAPHRRECWLALCEYFYQKSEWLNCYAAACECLRITDKSSTYLTDSEAWGAKPHDLAGVSAWHLGLKKESEQHIRTAIQLNPSDERLQNNLKFVTQSA